MGQFEHIIADHMYVFCIIMWIQMILTNFHTNETSSLKCTHDSLCPSKHKHWIFHIHV